MSKKKNQNKKSLDQTDETDSFITEVYHERSLGAKLRGYFFAGILVTAPLGITIYFSWLFVKYIDTRVSDILPKSFYPEHLLPYNIPGLGLVIVIVFFILVGWLTASFLGRLLVRVTHYIMAKVPVARSIYAVSKQILETIVSKRASSFNEVVLIEYPRRGLWGLGFVTGKTEGEIQDVTEDEVANVFVPTTPNPTSGFLLFVPRKDVFKLSMTVEEGIKMVISGGIVTPPDRRPAGKRTSNVIPSVVKKSKAAKRKR